MTLDAAEIDLTRTFEPGQGYVALSRIRSIEGLRLMGINDMALRVDPLILQIDSRMKEASKKAEEKLNGFDNLDEKFQNYIKKIGGEIDPKKIEKEKKELEKEEEEKKKALKSGEIKSLKKNVVPNYQKTKALIDEAGDFKDLVEKRGMTEETVIRHLEKILDEEPYLNLEKFKPDNDILEMVSEAVEDLKEEEKKENFFEDGRLKLKPIFEMLDGEISYTDIKLALLFLE